MHLKGCNYSGSEALNTTYSFTKKYHMVPLIFDFENTTSALRSDMGVRQLTHFFECAISVVYLVHNTDSQPACNYCVVGFGHTLKRLERLGCSLRCET